MEPEAQKIILARSIGQVEPGKPTDDNVVTALMSYVSTNQVTNAAARQAVESLLPKIRFTKAQLEGPVRQSFPDFAARSLEGMVTVVQIKTEPPKRLVEEDVIEALRRKSDLLMVTREDRPSAIVVLIRELQFEERQEQDRTQTIVLNDYDVDVMKAVLLMPRNASYLYDYSEGGAEIAYAYEIVVSQGGRAIFEKLIRKSVKRSYTSCSNPRIRNVFGGIQRADFWANDAVRSRCQNAGQRVRTSDLRQDVMTELTAAIAATSPIDEAIRRGQP
jgi:hypothetical protein